METLKQNVSLYGRHSVGSQQGFTLVELMIALLLFLIVIAGIYQTFTFQHEAYMQTESRVNMVQEARAAQFFLARDLKMAGYDPTTHAQTGYDAADDAQVSFSMDIAGTADPDEVEVIRFALTDKDGETVGDGLCPKGERCRLSREWCSDEGVCGGLQPVAENVEAIELCYTIGNMRSSTLPNNLERELITSVIVSLLMKQTYRTKNYENTDVYMPASGDADLTPNFIGDRHDGWGPFNDGFRRKLVVFEVKSRNIGMNPYLDF